MDKDETLVTMSVSNIRIVYERYENLVCRYQKSTVFESFSGP